jgi:short-subunit dehydrogenase
VVLVARNEKRLAGLAGDLPGARPLALDLSDPAAPGKLAAEVPAADILVNDAGVGTFGPFAAADLARTMAMIQLNVGALTELTHRYLPGMLERGTGRILNVASTAALQPGPFMAVYYATKAYVLSFSEAVAEELRGTGVTVTALCPGPTASGFQAEAAMETSRLVAGRRLPTAAAVAGAGHRAMLAGKAVAIVGFQNRLLAASVRVSPRSVVRRVVRYMQEPR